MTDLKYGPTDENEDIRITGNARTLKGWEQEPNFQGVELIPAQNVTWNEASIEISLDRFGQFVFYSQDGVINYHASLDQAREAAKKMRIRMKRSPKRKLGLSVIGLNNSSWLGTASESDIKVATVTGLHMGNGEFTGFSKDINKNAYNAMPNTPAARAILETAVQLKRKWRLVDKAIKAITLPSESGGYRNSIEPEEYERKISGLEDAYNKQLARLPDVLATLEEDLAKVDVTLTP